MIGYLLAAWLGVNAAFLALASLVGWVRTRRRRAALREGREYLVPIQ